MFEVSVTNQNFINEEIKTRLNSGNACYNSLQNHLPPSPLSKNIQSCNLPCCFVWVSNVVSYIKGGT
jgi:hypothetical protein